MAGDTFDRTSLTSGPEACGVDEFGLKIPSHPVRKVIRHQEWAGFEVIEPALTYATAMGAPSEPLEDMTARWGPCLERLIPENVDIVERCISETSPDAIVGSSRGASLAMNLRTRTLPMVLIAPAWRLRLPAVLQLLGARTPEQRAQVEKMFPDSSSPMKQ